MEIVIGISGASGSAYGIKLLEILAETDIMTHLVITKAAKQIMDIETNYDISYVKGLADAVYDENDFTAPVASGSHRFNGMIVAPCSMKTLGEIAGGMSDNLLGRVADVCLKEKRKLIMMPRETPLNQIHLENMLKLERAGGIILPACPGFYSKPKTIDDLVNSMAGRALDLMGIDNDVYKRWK